MSEAQTAQDAQTQRLRILLADDSRIIRVAVRRILEDKVELLEASDGEEALQTLLEDDAIDVLLTDLGMPKLDGYQLIERLRDPQNARRLRTLPIIVLSGADEPEEKQRALDAGASDYITKPFDTQQITERVEALAREALRHREAGGDPGSAEDRGELDRETGMANRALFEEQGEKDVAFAKRYSKELSLLLLRVDDIDALTESHGVALIEQMIRRLGEFIVQCLRRPDSVGRLGRHEFGILAPMTNDLGGLTVANRILDRVRSVRFNTKRGPLQFTVSLGLASPKVNGLSDYATLAAIAEERLARALQAGGDQVVYEAEDAPSALAAAEQDEVMEVDAADIAADTGDIPPVESVPPPPTVIALDSLPESLDVVRWLIAHEQGERLHEHRRALLQRLLPLLDFVADDEALNLDTPLAVMRSQLK